MYQICVSGASRGEGVEEGRKLAQLAGAAIAKGGHSLMTGATIGLPNFAAIAYKKAGGVVSVGISPATSKVEHVLKYRLPVEPYDTIIYSGMHYSGRDALLISSSDAVLSIGGRLGTLHESILAVETETPIAFLQGVGGTGAEFMDILHAAGREKTEDILFGDDLVKLLKLLVGRLDQENHKYRRIYE